MGRVARFAAVFLIAALAACGPPPSGKPTPQGRPTIGKHHHFFSLAAALVPAVGQQLVTSPGAWGGNPTSFTYLWQDCDNNGNHCTNIAGATGTSYVVQSSDSGYTIVSVVTAWNGQGSAGQASAPTGIVPGGFSISGDEIVGPSGASFTPVGANVVGQDFVWNDGILSGTNGCLKDSSNNCLISDWNWNAVRVTSCLTGLGADNCSFDFNPAPYLANLISVYTAMHIVTIVSIHNFTGGDPTNSGNALSSTSQAALVSFWTNMANTYRTNPYVWFNIVNEPTTAGESTVAWYGDVIGSIQAIRNAGANNVIVLDGNNYGQDSTIGCNNAGFTSPYDWSTSVLSSQLPALESAYDNIVGSVHMYQYWGAWSGCTETQATLNARTSAYVNHMHSLNLPIMIGETGDQPAGASGDTGNNGGTWSGTTAAFAAAEDNTLSPRVGLLFWHQSAGTTFCLVASAAAPNNTSCAGSGLNGWNGINSPTSPTNLTTFGQDLWNLAHGS